MIRWVAVAAGVLVLGACGSDDPTGVATARTDEDAGSCASEVCVSLTSDPDPLVAGADTTWHVTIENRGGAPVTLRFLSAQRAEVALLSGDREAWRWGADRVFAQVASDETLAPGRQLTFDLSGRLDVAPGRYELSAEVRADGAPAALSRDVEVKEAD